MSDSNDELPDDLHARIVGICNEAESLIDSGDKAEAWRKYVQALKLIPEPSSDWEATTWILVAMGDLLISKPDYVRALEIFKDAVRCPGGLGNGFIHLRLGQCYYELANLEKAADEFARAYMSQGREIFINEDPKYFRLVEKTLETPDGTSKLP